MLVGLNQGFGELIGPERMQRSLDYSVDVIRQDIPHDLTNLQALVDEFKGTTPAPLFLIHHMEHIQPVVLTVQSTLAHRTVMLQMWNEPPGLDPIDEATYVRGINSLARAATDAGFAGPILAGGLANPGRDNRAYMERVVPQLPRECMIDFHRYSYRTQTDPRTPWPNFKDRQAEISWMHDVADGRPISLTEGASYHSATETETRYVKINGFEIPLPWTSHDVALTREDIRTRTLDDLQLYEIMGVSLVCLYQERDGPEDVQGHYGYFLDYAGQVKPELANVIRQHKGQPTI